MYVGWLVSQQWRARKQMNNFIEETLAECQFGAKECKEEGRHGLCLEEFRTEH